MFFLIARLLKAWTRPIPGPTGEGSRDHLAHADGGEPADWGPRVYLPGHGDISLRRALPRVAAMEKPELVCECITQHSGYLRQAGIERAMVLNDTRYLPLLAARLNDWSAPVRQAAQQALAHYRSTHPAADFVPALAALHGAARGQRSDHAWIAAFVQGLDADDTADWLKPALASRDAPLRRAAYALAMDYLPQRLDELVAFGLGSRDLMQAHRALLALPRLDDERRRAHTPLGLRSPFGQVRQFAVDHAPAPLSREALLTLLFDPMPRIRQTAAAQLAALGEDVKGHVHQAIQDGQLAARPLCAALALLVQWRQPDVENLLRHHADDARERVRRQALFLWARVLPQERDAVASRALLDAAGSVRKLAVQLCREGAYVSFEDIAAMLHRHGHQTAALSLCARHPWDMVACVVFIDSLGERQPCQDERLRAALMPWLGNAEAGWTSPQPWHVALMQERDGVRRLRRIMSPGWDAELDALLSGLMER
ncbi:MULTISPECIES: hypothetical protein [unclassified Herbaspirillum]|uniref:hypothetical protein n=1 Tax=unclassified Herbaspirillum TaxID=2624150 RepID=UPI000C08FB50|nr:MULTISPECIES: hypothetical protein [unclassified Herbaspirillum]MAF02111.1 hypothetical protein [Herbaspirillum sp.]